jgi:streptomycin 6-kinase
MEIPARFAQHVRDLLGEAGADWLRGLPRLIADLSDRWDIRVGTPFGLSYNYVARARRRDGAEAVIKLAPPWDDGELVQEIHALRLYAGDGACRLLEADADLGALLLERLRPGTMLRELAETEDDAATSIGADLMQRLWRPAAELRERGRFRPLAEWFRALPRHRAFYAGAGPFPPAVLDHAEALVRELLATSPREVLLHADFHHDNVLASERAGWLAIDPKGMLGDPGYEIGPFLLNPDPDGPAKSAVLLNRRLDIFAAALAYDRARLRAWAIAYAVLSACWTAENNGDGWQPAIAAAETLIGR